MHFSIPDTQLFNANGSSYMGFNIHINGAFHCILRFRQLHCLHEQLRKAYPNRLPSFPPKKILPLSLSQLEDRRSQLERYLQLVGQDPIISKGYLLNNFLLTAQHELGSEKSREISLDVFLPHGVRRVIQITSTWSAPSVLSKVCEDLGLQKEFMSNFALYLARILKDGELELVRRLQAFEAPHLSLRQCHIDCNVHLRRAHWDAILDDRILTSNVALGLLYVQAVGDVERGWITCKDIGTLNRLEDLQNGGFTKEYLRSVRSLPTYGSVRFLPCTCDYPNPGNMSTATFSPRNITLTTHTKQAIKNERKSEISVFPVTRIRCWRLTTVHMNDDDISASSSNDDSTPGDSSASTTPTSSSSRSISTRLEFSFEFLVSRDNLRWITLASDQASLMSSSLQSIVDELVVKRSSKEDLVADNISSNEDIDGGDFVNWSYLSRDRGLIRFDSSKTDDNTVAARRNSTKKEYKNCNTTVIFNPGRESVQNEAFEDIGDDDL